MNRNQKIALLAAGVSSPLFMLTGCGSGEEGATTTTTTGATSIIPTPDGYTVQTFYCYNQWDPSDPTPHGYNLTHNSNCGSTSLLTWDDNRSSGYGRPSALLDCAKTCNQHDECGGFFLSDGRCSHWQAAPVNPASVATDVDCYMKVSMGDLDYVMDQEPAPPQAVPEPPEGAQISDCLCIFDIDRTLTAKQEYEDCPGTRKYPNIWDYAYYGGPLILSEMAMRLNETFCGECYFGIVSAGVAGGPKYIERQVLDTLVDPKYNVGGWNDGCPTPTWGTKQLCCGEGDQKSTAARDIVNWLGSKGITIADDHVHMFDDKRNNIEAFQHETFNAHQISCANRSANHPDRGGCGGRIDEIVKTAGVHFCDPVVTEVV